MKAGGALTIVAMVVALGAAAARAQSQPQSQPPAQTQPQPAPQTPPPADSVGPRELRDFSLPGTATRPADTAPAQQQPAAPAARPATNQPTAPAPSVATQGPRASAPTSQPAQAGGQSVTVTLPPATPAVEPSNKVLGDNSQASAPLESQPAIEPAAPPESATAPVEQEADDPWLWVLALAASAIGVAAAYLFLRQRRRSVDEVGAALEAFVPAEPRAEEPLAVEPAGPGPSRSPREAVSPPPPSLGIVSTGLRPWVDIEFVPLRCVVEQARATIEFEVNITNSGSAPARDLLVEAMLFNAGPAQDQEIGNFFAYPVGKGDAVPALAPLKSIQIRSSVNLPADQLRIFQVAGRQLFVPLIGFNALYRWGAGQGQTSRSYLVGREGQGEKMAPFRLDLGPRLFRGLGAREHHLHVRQ